MRRGSENKSFDIYGRIVVIQLLNPEFTVRIAFHGPFREVYTAGLLEG